MNLHDPTNPVIVSMSSATSSACVAVNVLEPLNKIRSGEWAPQIVQVRTAPTPQVKATLKRALSGILFCGRFGVRSRSGLEQPSGLLCGDIDHIPDPEVTRDRFAADPHCVSSFISPSGDGVKFVMAVDATRSHSDSWKAVRKYVKDIIGVDVDNSGSDISRLCYCSFDPEAFIAQGDVQCIPYPVTEDLPDVEIEIGMLSAEADYNNRGNVACLLRDHGWTSEDGQNWLRPGKTEGNSATLGIVEGPPNSLWVFSNNAPPFIPNKRYEPFAVFAALECEGDFALATSELQKRGFGTPGDDTYLILPSACGLTISDAAAKIFRVIGKSLTLFNRGRAVHEIIDDEHGARLEPMIPRAFRSRLDKFGKLMAWRADRDNRKKLSPAICAEETASALLSTTQARELLPTIRAIISSPALVLNGTEELVMLEHGYSPLNGGVFVTGHAVPLAVPLAEAVSALSSLLIDFDFQSQGDRSRALASFVTPALKSGGQLKCSTPIEVCEADKSQAGKGFLRKLVANIYGEIPSIVTQKEGGVGSLDESISSALVTGRQFVQLDNLRGKIASMHLEAILTAEGPVLCRVPNVASIEIDVRPFTFSMTSNGVSTTRDLANRCSIVRIKKRAPNYSFHVYPEGGVLEHVKALQPYYLGCVFAVIGEWFLEGCQRTTENRHDFRVWAQTLDWIVREVFEAAPVMEGHDEARDRVSDQGQTWLRGVALVVAAESRLDCDLTASELAEVSSEHDIAIPNCRADAEESIHARAVGKVMAKLFVEHGIVEVDNFTVNRSRRYSATAQKEVFFYRFTIT